MGKLKFYMHAEKTSVTITTSFKNLLALFENDAILEKFELADTQYPLSGFIDEKVFPAHPTIGHVLKFGYDFKGLVHFQARIGSFDIHLIAQGKTNSTFEIEGPMKKLKQVEHLIIEQNVYSPGKYKLIN